MTGMDRILRRDQALVLIALAALTVLSWIYLAILAADMAAGDMSLMGGPDMAAGKLANGRMGAMTASLAQWSPITFTLMLIMWSVMMVGMMLPSAAPMILLFAAITRKQARDENPALRISLFTATYLLIWAGFSLLATLAQWALTEAALLSPMMVGTSRALTVTLLAACGAYQLSPWKQACLGKCRSPLSFLMSHWQPGDLGALKMGFAHGAYCLGCCWLLMALLFLGGVMNLFWAALVAGLVLGEKVLPRGDFLGRLGGAAMLVLAAYLLLL